MEYKFDTEEGALSCIKERREKIGAITCSTD